MNKTTEFLSYYNNFVNLLDFIFPYEETKENLAVIKSFSDEEKVNRGIAFANSFNDDNFSLFLKKKLKVFSHKHQNTQQISESLFGVDFCLKNLLNNQSDDIKNNIWVNLHTLYLYSEQLKEEPKAERLLLLKSLDLKLPAGAEDTNIKNKLHEILDVDVNKETNDMINEIIETFETTLKNTDENPMAKVMELSQQISSKYTDKINNGDIELDKLMQSIIKKMPGMEKMMPGMEKMMSGFTDKKGKKERIIMDENFSTALVEAPELKDEKTKFVIGDALKTANQMGILGGNTPGKPGLPAMPDMSDIMNMMKGEGMSKMVEKMMKSQGSGQDMHKMMEEMMKSEDMNKMVEQLMKPK
jgi:hypothetical protein